MSGTDPATLPPDLARKVLGADLRNIVKKAGDGATLTSQERNLVREFLAEKVEPEELLATRRNSLLQMWAAGRKLSPAEFAEIADYLPAGSAEATAPAAAFSLATDPSGPTRTGRYPKPLAHYAAVYGQTDRTIKRYIAKGRKSEDFPPLDSPGDMPAWFARHHKHRVPDWLLDLGAKAQDTGPPAPSDEPESPAPATYVAPTELPIGLGFEAELVRVREEARKAAALLSEAEAGRIVSEIDAARRQYDRTLKLLREYERDAPKILASMGNLVDRSVYEALILTKHSAIRAESEAMYTVDLHRALRAAPDYEAARRIHVEAYHEILRALTTGGFGDKGAFALDAA